jgi:hypothetical protein
VVCTQAYPVVITGSHPANMTQSRLSSLEPCISRGSIISATDGVSYASPNGLVKIAYGGVQNITQELLRKDKWQALTPISTLRAARINGAYYAFGTVRPGVFNKDAFNNDAFTQVDYTDAYTGAMVDPSVPRLGFSPMSSEDPVTNVQNDPWSGEVFVIKNNNLYWLNVADPAPVMTDYLWRSKVFQTPEAMNLGAMRLYFTVPANAPALNPVRNTNLVQTLQGDQYGLVRVYADGELITTRELRTSGEIMRIVSDRKADFWQFEIEARVEVHSIQVGRSVKELRRS